MYAEEGRWRFYSECVSLPCDAARAAVAPVGCCRVIEKELAVGWEMVRIARKCSNVYRIFISV